MRLTDAPSFVELFASLDDVELPEGAVILAGQTAEPRSKSTAVVAANRGVAMADVRAEGTSSVVITSSGVDRRASLRNVDNLVDVLRALDGTRYLVDVTGMLHSVWAALLRAAWQARLPIWACYVEPAEYAFSRVPTQGSPFDLSLSISGLAPLPGFARLESRTADTLVVALLGFEGARFGYVLEQLEAAAADIVPIIGAPGFRIEYPLFAFVGNRGPLTASGAYERVRYATANDPFDLFFALEDLQREVGEHRPLVIAPIGTKPHAVGAVLYALDQEAERPGRVELVYDHPDRNPRRTRGQSRLLLYYVSEFAAFLAGRSEATQGEPPPGA
jgi:hypothetical protein